MVYTTDSSVLSFILPVFVQDKGLNHWTVLLLTSLLIMLIINLHVRFWTTLRVIKRHKYAWIRN